MELHYRGEKTNCCSTDNNMPKYVINPCKRYQIPEEISVVNRNGLFLVIAPNIAGWVVLQSKNHLSILFEFKKGASIEEIISNQSFERKDVAYVVTQIEARRFFEKKVSSSTKDGKNLHLYLTNMCNLSCPHCYMFSGKASEDELTTSEIMKLLTDYKTIAHGSNVTLSGGEPTVRRDFDFIVQQASDIGLRVRILTNGALLTHRRLEKLVKYLDSVQISIDGFSEETNAKIRGKGHFEKALSAVKILLSFGVKTSIAVTPPYEILKEHMNDYISFARNLEQRYKGKPLEIKFAGELLSGRLLHPTDNEQKSYLSLIESIQKELNGPDYDVFLFVRQFAQDNIIDNCMFGGLSVASNGDVFFCARTSDLRQIANIRTSSFNEIYLKSIMAERATSVTLLKPCKDCDIRYICGGGCRIEWFPDLVKRDSFDRLDYESILPRKCNDIIKTQFYDLMIRGNKYLYTPLKE